MKVRELIDKLKQGNLEHDVFVSPLRYFDSLDDAGPQKIADPFKRFTVEMVGTVGNLEHGLENRIDYMVIGFEVPDGSQPLSDDDPESVH